MTLQVDSGDLNKRSSRCLFNIAENEGNSERVVQL